MIAILNSIVARGAEGDPVVVDPANAYQRPPARFPSTPPADPFPMPSACGGGHAPRVPFSWPKDMRGLSLIPDDFDNLDYASE